MNATRGLFALILVLGVAQSCSNDFDKFEVTEGSGGSSSGGQLAFAGNTSKAGTTSRAGTTSNVAGMVGLGGADEGGAAATGGAAGTGDAGAPAQGGMAGMGGPEPEPCGGPCTLDNATALCVDDACAIDQCAGDWGDCNQSAPDGCEHSVVADTGNCGECARACGTTNVAAVECSSGACSSSCAPGFANCTQSELPDDGCETPVLTDTAHCGGCDNTCPSGFVCMAGQCSCNGGNDCGNGNGVDCVNNLCECDQLACRPGERCRDDQGAEVCSCNGSTAAGCSANEFCCADGGCTDVASNAANCGACGRVCSAGFICATGACQCDSVEDCGGMAPEPGGEAGAATGAAGGPSDAGGAGGASPTLPVACVIGLCVCSGNTCAEGQRCLADGSCG